MLVLDLLDLVAVQLAAVFDLPRLLVSHVHIDDTSTDLELSEHAGKDLDLLLHEDNCAKFAQVVLEIELVLLEFDFRVLSRHRDVSHTDFLVDSSPHFAVSYTHLTLPTIYSV